jgi:hypothetical protein
MTEQPHTVPDDTLSPTWRFVGIVGVFLVVGPPVGGVVLWIEEIARAISRGQGIPREGFFPALFLFAIYSYPLGAPFALASGIIHAVLAIWLRQTSILVPMIVGSVAGVAFAALLTWISPSPGGQGLVRFKATLMWTGPVPLIASFVCWRLTRGIARAA